MRYDVSVIGLYILDILGRPVSQIPEGGGVDFIEEIKLTVAGTAGGTVINTAKLGLKSLAVGAVGDDEKADWIILTLAKHAIDTSLMRRLAGVPTSSTILNIRPNGERPALHVRGASDHLEIPPAIYDQVFDTPIVHLGGTGLLEKLDGPASLTLLSEAKARGCTVTFDLIAANSETAKIVAPLLPFIDYFMPSMEEAAFLSGKTEPAEVAETFLAMGAGACIFKWGARGSYVHTRAERFRVPGFRVKVSDTTGCGDSYCGGFVAGLAMGRSLREACLLGTATSALVATGLGSDAGVVDLAQVEAFAASTERLD